LAGNNGKKKSVVKKTITTNKGDFIWPCKWQKWYGCSFNCSKYFAKYHLNEKASNNVYQ
jgi:hypothetical protein